MKTLVVILNDVASGYFENIRISIFSFGEFLWDKDFADAGYLRALLKDSVIVVSFYDDIVPMAGSEPEDTGKRIHFSVNRDDNSIVCFTSKNIMSEKKFRNIVTNFIDFEESDSSSKIVKEIISAEKGDPYYPILAILDSRKLGLNSVRNFLKVFNDEFVTNPVDKLS